MTPPRSFEEFWPYYVSQHMNGYCRLFHIGGNFVAFAYFVWAVAYWPLLAVLAPAVGYAMSWTGHFVFEKNRPASWYSARYFRWSFRADLRMVHRTVTGRMRAELARAEELYPPAPASG